MLLTHVHTLLHIFFFSLESLHMQQIQLTPVNETPNLRWPAEVTGHAQSKAGPFHGPSLFIRRSCCSRHSFFVFLTVGS